MERVASPTLAEEVVKRLREHNGFRISKAATAIAEEAASLIEAQDRVVSAAQECWDQSVEIHRKRGGVTKYGAPYGGLVKIKEALDALPTGSGG